MTSTKLERLDRRTSPVPRRDREVMAAGPRTTSGSSTPAARSTELTIVEHHVRREQHGRRERRGLAREHRQRRTVQRDDPEQHLHLGRRRPPAVQPQRVRHRRPGPDRQRLLEQPPGDLDRWRRSRAFSDGASGNTTMASASTASATPSGAPHHRKTTGAATQTGTFSNNTVGGNAGGGQRVDVGRRREAPESGGGALTWTVQQQPDPRLRQLRCRGARRWRRRRPPPARRTRRSRATRSRTGGALAFPKNGIQLNIGTVTGRHHSACAQIRGNVANGSPGTGGVPRHPGPPAPGHHGPAARVRRRQRPTSQRCRRSSPPTTRRPADVAPVNRPRVARCSASAQRRLTPRPRPHRRREEPSMAEPFLSEIRHHVASASRPRAGRCATASCCRSTRTRRCSRCSARRSAATARELRAARPARPGADPHGRRAHPRRAGRRAGAHAVDRRAPAAHPRRAGDVGASGRHRRRPTGNLPGAVAQPALRARRATSRRSRPTPWRTSGGSQAHLNMQPFLTLNFCIALQGIFPSPT